MPRVPARALAGGLLVLSPIFCVADSPRAAPDSYGPLQYQQIQQRLSRGSEAALE